MPTTAEQLATPPQLEEVGGSSHFASARLSQLEEQSNLHLQKTNDVLINRIQLLEQQLLDSSSAPLTNIPLSTEPNAVVRCSFPAYFSGPHYSIIRSPSSTAIAFLFLLRP